MTDSFARQSLRLHDKAFDSHRRPPLQKNNGCRRPAVPERREKKTRRAGPLFLTGKSSATNFLADGVARGIARAATFTDRRPALLDDNFVALAHLRLSRTNGSANAG